jgi:purine-nucleoside phosphorylase
MKITNVLSILLITGMIFVAACSGADKEVKKDAVVIADAMCRNIEIMNKLRTASPADSELITKLQEDAHKLQIEMTILYKEFEEKYKEEVKNEKFSKEFSEELRKAMLPCPYLSKEDREKFEKEIE